MAWAVSPRANRQLGQVYPRVVMTRSAADRPPPGPATSRAVVYLLLARAVRDFGDGFAAILLPVYLLELGFSPLQIGVLATIALLGSALLTLGIGLIGSRHDRQR